MIAESILRYRIPDKPDFPGEITIFKISGNIRSAEIACPGIVPGISVCGLAGLEGFL